MVGPARPQIVLFGSSIVELSYRYGGWGAILSDLYARKADIVLRGYSGWNFRCALQVLEQVFPKDAAVQPSLVIVYFGGNDSIRPHPDAQSAHVPLPEYVENMRKIAIHLKSLSEKTRVIFLTAPPVNEAQIFEFYGHNNRTNELCHKYSEACKELCQQLDVKVVDLWTALQQRKDWMTSCFLDGIHLTSEGSKIVAKEILKVVKEAEWKPSLHWKSMGSEYLECVPFIPIDANGNKLPIVEPAVCQWQAQWE